MSAQDKLGTGMLLFLVFFVLVFLLILREVYREYLSSRRSARRECECPQRLCTHGSVLLRRAGRF